MIPRGPTFGEPASLADIQTEFGGSNPISLNEYYAGGANVFSPPPTSGEQTGPIPASGAISIGNFLGVSANFIFNDVVSSNVTNYNLSTRATAAGWDGLVPLIATIVINSGVEIVSSAVGTAAFRVPALPGGSTVALTNNGTIEGRGGVGGDAADVTGTTIGNGANGTAGGPGMLIQYATSITNNGIIGGGGAGGGGGGAGRRVDSGTSTGIAGGGGGGGRASGAAGAGGSATGNSINNSGIAGTAGSISSPGSGGNSGNNSPANSGSGGDGGRLGQDGYNGTIVTLQPGFDTGAVGSRGLGGAGGNAFTGGSLIDWKMHGDIYGDVDNWGTYTGTGTNRTSLISARTDYVQDTPTSAAWTSALGTVWYWDTKNSGQQTTPNAVKTFYIIVGNTGGTASFHVYGAVDDKLNSMTVNGVSVTPGTAMGDNAAYSTNSFSLPTGMNVISVTLENDTAPNAGFNLRIRRTSDNIVFAGPDGWFY